MSAVFLSWYGVLSVGRSSITARWSHVVRLWSHSTVHRVLVGWVDTLVAVANGAETVALLEALLLYRWSHMASGLYIVVFQVS